MLRLLYLMRTERQIAASGPAGLAATVMSTNRLYRLQGPSQHSPSRTATSRVATVNTVRSR